MNLPLRRIALQTLALALLGSLAGTLGDQIHVQFHVLSYPGGVWWLAGQAVWVPLLFAAAGPALVFSHALSARMGGGEHEPMSRSDVWKPAAWHIAAYFSTGVFQAWPRALAAGLVLAWLARVMWRPHRAMVLHSLSCAVGGPLVEALISSTGGFAYANPSFVYVPIWLPALYLHVAPLARHLYVAFIDPPVARTVREPEAYLSLRSLDGD